MNIIGFSGSLRKGSFNSGLLRYAKEVAPENVTIEILEIGNLPLYNQDLDGSMPAEVKALKEKVKAADAVLFATPEYNYSVPGVLKNAIDWISRPYGDNSFNDKPVGIMGASVGLGTVRAQYHLRQICVFLNMHPVNQPEMMTQGAGDKFDGEGNITDAKTKEKVKEMVEALAAWTERIAKK